MIDWLDRPLADIAAGFRARQITPEDLAETAIERHARNDAALNAYKSWDADKLRAQAHAAQQAATAGYDLGPMQGIPVSVKDLYGVAGWPV